MTIVAWATLTTGQTEQLVGVLLGRQLPNSIRLRPSQGDGGIDVLDPVADQQVDVYQIKYFATALDSSRWTQIERSLRRVADNPTVHLRDWYLVLPLNPSPNDLEKFKELEKSVPFACHWYGLDRLESLAAAHQDVVDYYLHDGRQRRDKTIEDLRALVGIARPAVGQIVAPGDITNPLASLYELLNRDDPHYRYEFAVTTSPPGASHFIEQPGLVASFAHGRDGVAVIHHIFARYRMATEDAPIPLTFTVQQGEMDNATAAEWQRAIRYGTPVLLPIGTVTDAHFGLPGGLAANPAEIVMRMSAASGDSARPYRLRLRLVDPEGLQLADALMAMEPVTRGMIGGGTRAYGTEAGGAFSVEILIDIQGDGTLGDVRFNLSIADLTGLPPAAIRSGLRFLAAFHQPNCLEFAPEFGPGAGDALDLPVDAAPVTPELVELVEALADLHERVAASLQMPDLDALTVRDRHEILRAGQLVRGETVQGNWEEHSFVLTEPSRFPTDGPVQLALCGKQDVAVGDQVVTLEPVTIVLLAAELTVTPDDAGVRIAARPTLGNNRMLLRLAPIDEVPPQVVDQSG